MAESKSVTQLPDVGQFTADDRFLVSHKTGSNTWASRSAALAELGLAVVNALNYETLETVNKTIIGAIAELNSSKVLAFGEEVQIGWFGENPLYKKIINCGNLPNNTVKSIPHDIAHIGYILRNEVVVTLTSGTSFSTPYGNPANPGYVQHVVSSTNIAITTNSDRSTATAIAILEYTKN